MRKNKITGGLPNSGRKKEINEPVLVSFKVEKSQRDKVNSLYRGGVSEKLRDFYNKF